MTDNLRIAERLARAALLQRRQLALFRIRRIVEPVDCTHVQVDGRELINFAGNDYLGLAHHPDVVAALNASPTAGSGAAALVSGRTAAHERAERSIAAWKNVDQAVLLPSGYQANFAAVQTMAAVAEAGGKSPRFLVDKLVHASLIDAVRSTSAELRTFPHNGLTKLERLLSDACDERLDIIITESIFSMDGDAADLAAIVALRERYSFALIVDEAHATGIYGPDGAGLVSQLGLTNAVDLGIATFSKALGVAGGAVYGSTALVEAVVNFGRAYIYTTSPPAGLARAITAAIDLVRTDDARRTRLRANIARLRDGIRALGLATIAGDSPIVPLLIGDVAKTLEIAQRLLEAGFFVIAVRPPTVPRGTSRLRLTVSSEHSAEAIDALLATLRGVTSETSFVSARHIEEP